MQAKFVDSPDTFLVSLMGYCGMRIPIVDEGDKQECRSAVAKELRTLRAQGFPIQTQTKGESWEVCEPEDCAMVPDSCGILSLRPIRVPVFECYICGCDVPKGESCNCNEPCEEEETEEESEEEESVECPDCTEPMVYSHPGKIQGAWFSCPNPECKRTVPLLVL